MQLLAQCDLWKQRILPSVEELVYLSERPLSMVEELLVEMMVLKEKGAIVFASVRMLIVCDVGSDPKRRSLPNGATVSRSLQRRTML